MNLEFPKIYPITDARISGLSHAEQVKRLIGGGAKIIQLREKHAAPKEFFRDAESALKTARAANVKIIVNDRVDIALALGADGVHLGQDDLPPREARKILGEKAIIGFSTHNLKQAEKGLEFPVDYLAVGPIFTTTTKENPDKIVTIEALKKIRALTKTLPLIAIGGIGLENFREILDLGVDSVAVISGILSAAEEISETMKTFVQKSE